jgi:hypothetical protein
METAIIAGSLIVLFVITWTVIACNAPSDPFVSASNAKSFKEWELEDQLKRAKYENERLHGQIRFLERTRCPLECWYKQKNCSHCEPKTAYYAETVEQQNLLTKGMRPLEELKRALNIK